MKLDDGAIQAQVDRRCKMDSKDQTIRERPRNTLPDLVRSDSTLYHKDRTCSAGHGCWGQKYPRGWTC